MFIEYKCFLLNIFWACYMRACPGVSFCRFSCWSWARSDKIHLVECNIAAFLLGVVWWFGSNYAGFCIRGRRETLIECRYYQQRRHQIFVCLPPGNYCWVNTSAYRKLKSSHLAYWSFWSPSGPSLQKGCCPRRFQRLTRDHHRKVLRLDQSQ